MRKNLTPKQVQEIVNRYPNEKSVDIAEDFGIKIYAVYKTAQRYGVKKSDSFKNSPNSGRIQKGNCLSPETQFKKGHIGNTKGKRMEALIKKEEKLIRWRSGLWKPGNKPFNTANDGDIRYRPKVGYWFIRISENNWEFYHRHIWEKKFGKIPDGHNIYFKDGNHKNCVIENLECISDAELGERNRITKYPKELQDIIKAKNNLNKLLKQITNER